MKKQTNATIKAHLLQSTPYLLLLAAGTVMAVFVPQPPTRVSHLAGAQLTFAERVSYQRAIEDVYWRHRIWPKENPSPKPPLDAVMSEVQLEGKVEDYLLNSQALADKNGGPLSAEQLQAEMERMAQHSKQPEVLRELFAALGNDPFVIAECLIRPVLTERMISGSHVTQAKIGLSTPKVMAAAAVHYSLPKISGGDDRCTDNTWTPTSITNAPDSRRIPTAVWTGTEVIIWGGFDDSGSLDTGGRYDPSTDSWTPTTAVNAPESRSGHTAVWTGTEMIVWGGLEYYPIVYLNTGGRYNPSTDSWVATTTTDAADPRWAPTAVWTGTEMIVWGGQGQNGFASNTGGRYNPGTDGWTATTTTNAPAARLLDTAVWTGSEMIVWGGSDTYNLFNSGGRYNPDMDSWTATSTTNAPTAREVHTAVWTGREMIVWGGSGSGTQLFHTGGTYNPLTDTWVATSRVNAPSARTAHTAVWTGGEMIVWGGVSFKDSNLQYLDTGGRYDAFTDSWTETSTVNAPSKRASHIEVWTGSEMMVWGGYFVDIPNVYYLNTGGRYCTQPSPPITLSAARRKVEGINTVHLTWSGATSRQIDVYRCVQRDESGFDCNPIPIVTTANDDAFTDSTGDTGRASYKYRVCEAGTSTCSNTAEVPK